MSISNLIAGIPYPSNTHASCSLLSCTIRTEIGGVLHAVISLGSSSLESG